MKNLNLTYVIHHYSASKCERNQRYQRRQQCCIPESA